MDKASACSADARLFSAYLQSIGEDWLLVEQAGEQRARLRFTGPFMGKTVVWDCEFLTLASISAERNFIDIGAPGARGVPLIVGLALARIDRPAIEKMIIMMRNYKRLRTGRHEYGQW
jgi:hypothetical protein